MKHMNFRFFFMTVIWSGVGMGFLHGLADKFIQTHGGYVSFATLAILFTSVIGMMRNIQSPMKVKKQRVESVKEDTF